MGNKQIRVLQVINDFKKGGVQADVMYPARIIDPKRVTFDVMLLSDITGYYEDEFRKHGDIYRIPLSRKKSKFHRALSVYTNFFIVYKEMRTFFNSHHDYDAVETRHILLNAPCILAAKKANIPVRIAHCHVNRPVKIYKDRLYVKVYLWACARIMNACTTHEFGVTRNACEYMFGKNNGTVVKNPTVDLLKFDPSKYKLSYDDSINIIIIGSYSQRKNQKFALEVLEELQKIHKNTTLTLIGYPRSKDDTYLSELQSYVINHRLSNYVHFLPQDSDIPYELSKANFMLITSLQEGLPNVALEAQAMGVPCFISDDVSKDCDCGICKFLSLSIGAKAWAEEIMTYKKNHGTSKKFVDMSNWDNRKVCESYIEYWSGNK